jgi:ubiquinone/menaquinone biosynthesis C-methylase UbiE
MEIKKNTLDDITKRVTEMYNQYPYPLVGTHREMFKDLVYPFLMEQGNVYSILEAGCGTGNVAIAIAQLFPETRVVGIDVTEESLRIAKESAAKLGLKNIEFRYSNLLEYDAELGTFDFIHCQGVIHHLSDPRQGLENLYKYLNPGRHAYIWVYMLLGRRWILEIREILNLLQTIDKPYEERIEFSKKILSVFRAKKASEGLKRHHDKKPAQINVHRPLNSRLLSMLEISIRVLNESGWKVLGQRVMQKFYGGLESIKTPHSTNSVTIAPELEARRYDTGLADTLLHPHDIFYRMSEILDLFAETGFSEIRISDGMSANLEQFFANDFSDIKQLVENLPIEKQYQFMEILERPSGIGFFVRKVLG